MAEPYSNTRVVWQPHPGSQTLALCCPAHHILYEGSRGPGKTDAQLMFFRKHVGQGYGAHWRGVIFDREYKNLDDLINKSLRWFPQFRDGARFLSSKSDYRWVWPTGEQLLFRQFKKKDDYWNYHGQEFAFIGWNELCKYATPDAYEVMMSCNRTSFLPLEHSPDKKHPLPKIPLVVFATANPYGPGHGWVKKCFVDAAPPGVMVRKTVNVFNPQTQKVEPVTKGQVRIFGSYKENRYLTPEYIAEIATQRDESKRKAWLHGDWNIVAGGAFSDLWDESVHVIPRSAVPHGWRVDRAHDWGSAKPFSVGWWALADGEEMTLSDGRIFCPVRGSLIRLTEWYGANPAETNVGLNLSARSVAEGTKGVDEALLQKGWIRHSVRPGPADNSIFDDPRKDTDSIALEMSRIGVTWEHSNKSPGSRKRGMQLVRDRLENALTGEGPALYIMDNCRDTIAQLPNLPRDPDDPDDVDSTAEDHIYDELRYRVLKGAEHTSMDLEVKTPS